MMKKKQKKDNTFAIVVLCVVGIVVFGLYGLFNKKVRSLIKEIRNRDQGVVAAAGGLNVDVTEAAMNEYIGSISVCNPISIRIIETTDEFTVEVSGAKESTDSVVSFKVSPVQKFRFSSIPIESLVQEGLKSSAEEGTLHQFAWKNVSISTNKYEGIWHVSVNGITGEGSLVLNVGAAYASCRVNLPQLFPIWDFIVYTSFAREEVYIGNCIRTPNSPPIKPNREKGVCGYKLLAVTGKSVWFEVLYNENSVEGIRKRWPGLEINYQKLDNGEDYSSIKFESGKIMKSGDEAFFEDDHTTLKLERSGFLNRNAVRFRYYGTERKAICDILCITLKR